MSAVVVTELDDATPVLGLLDRARAVDGFSAVNESGRLALAAGAGRLHVLAGPAAHPLGYAGVELPDPPATGGAGGDGGDGAVTAELVVDPGARRQGIGSDLLAAVRRLAAAECPGSPVRVWAHEDTTAARRLATAAGMTATRTLLLLRRPAGPASAVELPAVEVPAGVRLAAFRPGVDEQAWLAVNAAAFAFHPEQGRWTAAELAAREAEPWFDPAGFLLAWAEDGDRLLGFDWTKVPTGPATGPAIGEIYVLAVSPTAGVRGLGTALAAAGLAHLHGRGVDTVELYVEADNERALNLYRRVGFVEHSRDVQWTAPALGA